MSTSSLRSSRAGTRTQRTRTPSARRRACALLLSAGIACVLGGCAGWNRGPGDPAADGSLAGRVRDAVARNGAAPAGAVGVDVIDATVLLTGFVPSLAAKDAAEHAAASVRGVRNVRNQLVVRP